MFGFLSSWMKLPAGLSRRILGITVGTFTKQMLPPFAAMSSANLRPSSVHSNS
jgi:hypothetical protein